jgi:hypothetical protein
MRRRSSALACSGSPSAMTDSRLVGGSGEVGRCGRVRGLLGGVVGELGVLGAEVVEAGVQVRDALLAAVGGELALL